VSSLFPECPAPPSWQLDWERIAQTYSWVADLRACPQDPEHHAEGDVWRHTQMAVEQLIASAGWRASPAETRELLFAATLLHDVGKPACTRPDEDGRLHSYGHSVRGEILARQILWRLGTPIELREQVAALVRFHQKPFYLLEECDSQRLALQISQLVRCDLLAVLAEADARGRVCADSSRTLDNIALFHEFCQEQGCLAAPFSFASDHSRFLYFRTPGRDPAYPAYDDTRCEVVLMSGLPSAGKDHWIQTNLPDWPVISLDAIRRELKVGPTEPQGPVIAAARDRGREHLRRAQPFVWNATNLSRPLRAQPLKLFADYNARVRIVYVETTEPRLLQQNHEREWPVPEPAIAKLLGHWQVPDCTEAHRVDWIVGD
jgi:predicted kinase